MLESIYLNLLKLSTCDISNISISTLMLKMIFIKYLPPARPKLAPKLKMLRIYWNLAHLMFRISPSRFWCQRLFLLNIYHLISIGPKTKSTQNLLKFGTFNISSISRFWCQNCFFIKYFAIARPQLVQNEKYSEFIGIW